MRSVFCIPSGTRVGYYVILYLYQFNAKQFYVTNMRADRGAFNINTEQRPSFSTYFPMPTRAVPLHRGLRPLSLVDA